MRFSGVRGAAPLELGSTWTCIMNHASFEARLTSGASTFHGTSTWTRAQTPVPAPRTRCGRNHDLVTSLILFQRTEL